MTESTNQIQPRKVSPCVAGDNTAPLTLEHLSKAMDEFKAKSVSLYKAMAFSGIDIIPDPRLPSNYWCVKCSPDIYTKIQVEVGRQADV